MKDLITMSNYTVPLPGTTRITISTTEQIIDGHIRASIEKQMHQMLEQAFMSAYAPKQPASQMTIDGEYTVLEQKDGQENR